jgi:energy-converting hydrogenase Eha subunit E
MYHVFQPYNELMKVKSPMFTICNIMVAVIGILLIWLPLNRIATLLLEVVAIMALLLFSHIMVKEFGPDNFYVKL